MSLRVTSSAIALMILSGPAAYALTPEEAWSNWEQYFRASGYEVTVGSRSGDASALTLNDVVLEMAIGEEGENSSSASLTKMILPVVTMTDAGDKKVETSIPQPILFESEQKQTPYTYRMEEDPAEPTTPAELETVMLVKGQVDVSGAKTVSSDIEGGQRDISTADEITATVSHLQIEDDVFEGEPMTLVLRDNSFDMALLGGANNTVEGSIGEIDMALDMQSPTSEEKVKFQGKVSAVKVTSETKVPAGMILSTPESLNEALKAAAMIKGVLNFDSIDLNVLAESGANDEEAEVVTLDASSGAGSLNIELTQDGLVYQSDLSDIAYKLVMGPEKREIAFGIESIALDLGLPLLKAEESQPFKFAYSVSDLKIGDSIWDEFDAGKVFERTPFNIDMDITGNLMLQTDLLNIENTSRFNPETGEFVNPILPVDVDVNAVSLEGLGVTAKASGNVSYPDRDDLSIMKGQMEARYTGINALLGKLVEAEILTEDDVSGMRMMMMMGTRAVEGQEDTLETKAEFHEDGSIIVNGQPMR